MIDLVRGASLTERWAIRAGQALLGRRFGALLDELECEERLAPDERRRLADERLRRILRHAVATVPFWREAAGASGADLALEDPSVPAADALRLLPVVDKATFRSREQKEFLSEAVGPERRLPYTTSGSTGEPFAFFLDRAAMPVVFASHLHFDRAFGIGPFDRCVRVMTPAVPDPPLPEGASFGFRVRTFLSRLLYRTHERWTQRRLSLFEVDEESAPRLRAMIEEFGARVLMGYTGSLAQIADALLERGEAPVRGLKAVVTIAENLTPERERSIRAAFPAPIANRYGQREFKFWCAQSCEASTQSFHVHTALVHPEVLDEEGRPVAPGETGRLVLTHLHNRVQPFVRYDTGDLAVLEEDASCPCGRTLPLIRELVGRSVECFRSPSGRIVSPVQLGQYLFVTLDWTDRLLRFQLLQEASDRAVLLVVPHGRLAEEERERLRGDLARLLGDDVSVDVKVVGDIACEKSGKRPIIKVLAGRVGAA